MSTNHWLYVKVGTPGVLAAESLLRHVLAPFMTELGYLGDGNQSKWFFLRYLDPTGLHVRIRIRGRSEALQEVDSALRNALERWCSHDEDRITYVRRAVYVPEWVKWGGLTASGRQKVCAASSRLALSLPATCWEHRHGIALLLMRHGIRMLPPEQRASFTYNYAWFWSGGHDPTIPSIREVVRHGARQAAVNLASQMKLWESSTGQWRNPLESYLQALEEDLLRSKQPAHRLFNHMHLTSNRLGVSPRDEALLAEVLFLRDSPVSDFKEAA